MQKQKPKKTEPRKKRERPKKQKKSLARKELKDIEALRRVQTMTPDEIPTMIATKPRIEKALAFADLLLCAVAVHGERTPLLLS